MTNAERKERAHRDGKIVVYGGAKSVSEPYKRFIGVISDEAIYRAVRGGLSPSQVDKIIDASGGSPQVMSYAIRLASQYGIEKLQSMSTDDFVGKWNVGSRRTDVLVALGVEDRRRRDGAKARHIDGDFDGFIDGKPVKGHLTGTYTPSNFRKQ